MGKLKVQIRTQNIALVDCFNQFFTLISAKESAAFDKMNITGYAAEVSRDSFTRLLINNSQHNEEEKGAVIGKYLNMLNKAVRSYFSAPDELKYVVSGYNAEFSAFIKENVI
jgi:hypothetical protein